MPRIVIVGAGISGLALAYRLDRLRPNVELTILEQRNRSGGTIWTERREGFQLEIGPNGFLDNKPSTIGLCQDLGLGDRLVGASPVSGSNRYLFLDGRLRKLPAGLGAFLGSDLLSWRGKLSVLFERFRRRRTVSGPESIDAFVRRRLGAEAAENLADALVTGIHAGDPSLLDVRAALPRLPALEAQYGSLIKGMNRSARDRRRAGGANYRPGRQMWSFREGLRLLVETLSDKVGRAPILGVGVRRLEPGPPGQGGKPTWLVKAEGRDKWPADVVILTCPAPEQATLLGDVDPELANRLEGIHYNRVAVVGLGFRQADVPNALDGFGYIAPQRTRRDLLGVQWCSSIFSERAPRGTVLLRALCGGWNRGEIVDWDDDRLVRAVRAELTLALGITAEPIFQHIIRWHRAIPQYHLGHPERVAWIENRLDQHPGLFLAGNAFHGVALNDCTEQAGILADRILDYLPSDNFSPQNPA